MRVIIITSRASGNLESLTHRIKFYLSRESTTILQTIYSIFLFQSFSKKGTHKLN